MRMMRDEDDLGRGRVWMSRAGGEGRSEIGQAGRWLAVMSTQPGVSQAYYVAGSTKWQVAGSGRSRQFGQV